MVKIEHNLTRSDFRLYDFLKKQDPNEWITQKEIALALQEVFPCTLKDMQDFHNAPARHQITDAIRRLNASDLLPKPILSGARGVKIANEQEFDLYINSNIKAVLNRLKRLKKLAEKGNKNGQYRFKLSKYQKEVYESFIEDDMQR